MKQTLLKSFFKPDVIAVVGASEKPGPGSQIIKNLRTIGFKGNIIPINPKYKTVLGIKSYSSLTDATKDGISIDLVAIMVGKDHVLPVMKEIVSIGVKSVWAYAAGFGEADISGKLIENEIYTLCTKNNILFLGPNCVGYLNINDKTAAYSTPVPKKIKNGNLGMVAQSGYLGLSVANNSRGLGFGLICTTGNEIIIDIIDCIEYMLEDEKIEVILVFAEQFRRPNKLIDVAWKAKEKRKPIILLKVGKSAIAKRATVTHTGAIAGSDDVQDALFKKLGIIRVNDLDEMFETAELLSKTKSKMPKGGNLFALTTSGGVVGLLGDLSISLNINFPSWSENGKNKLQKILPDFSPIANPLDTMGKGQLDKTYLPCLQTAVDEQQSDMVLIVQDVTSGMARKQVDLYKVIANAVVQVANETVKPLIMLSNQSGSFNEEIRKIMESNNIPLLQGTRNGLLALHHLVNFSKFIRKPTPLLSKLKHNRYANSMLPEGDADLTEYDSKKLLAKYDIPVVEEYLCLSRDEASKKSMELGYPVVMKVISKDILHKTEAGVVKLNIKTPLEAKQAYDELINNATTYKQDVHIQGVICCKMIEDIVTEVIVGILSDSYFGSAIIFGLGGIMAEIFKEFSMLIPPFEREEVRRTINSTKGSELLYGFRNKPKGDIEALIDVIMKIGEMSMDLAGRIHELDINPLLVLPEGKGVIVVDALVSIKRQTDKKGIFV